MEQHVWSNHRPWVPRPLLSLDVRMGDKACEMKVSGFQMYMELASEIRQHFLNLKNIWLSTEMQAVIDKTSLYPPRDASLPEDEAIASRLTRPNKHSKSM